MDYLERNGNVCRICLEYLDNKVTLNWNEEIFEFCGISYKDCYYKYTQLYETDPDCYPTNLCEMCADELKNAHFLFEKAMESFNILQVTLTSKKLEIQHSDVEISNAESEKEYKIHTAIESNSIKLSEVIINSTDVIKDVTKHQSNATQSINTINNSKEIPISENVTIEPIHFIDIKNFELSDEISLEQLSQSNNAKLQIPSAFRHNRKRNMYVNKISNVKKVPEISDAKLKANENKSCEPSSQSSLEQNVNKKDDQKSKIPSTANAANKTRKKYILICQYCSLKVNGTNQLKKHEATHSENRERTETCTQCGVKLYTKMALNQHMKVHLENRQKNHKCEFCEKAFFHKGGLNVHRRIHLGLMVKCQICSKEFFRQIDLDKHLITHSAPPLQKYALKKKYVVQCQYCNKSVSTNKWKEHSARHLDQPQMKCKICDKKFFAKQRCTKHIKNVHHKNSSEYESFVHYFVDHNLRITNLRMKQQLKVQQLRE